MLKTHHNNSNIIGRIVILGATGFVGKNLVKKFENQPVEILPLNSRDLDLRNPESVSILKNILIPSDVIVMLASIPPISKGCYNTFKENLQMCETALISAKEKSISQFIYLSSDAVFNPSIENITDDTQPSPTDYYGLMHFCREIMCRNMLPDSNFTIIRPTMIIGAGDTHNAYGPNRFIKDAISTKIIKLFGKGEDIKDFLYIDDITTIIAKIIYSGLTGTINVASGTSYKYSEVANIVTNIIGGGVTLDYLPRTISVRKRFFSNSELESIFPDFKFTDLNKAVNKIMLITKNDK